LTCGKPKDMRILVRVVKSKFVNFDPVELVRPGRTTRVMMQLNLISI
jgi:hypothetical protein